MPFLKQRTDSRVIGLYAGMDASNIKNELVTITGQSLGIYFEG